MTFEEERDAFLVSNYTSDDKYDRFVNSNETDSHVMQLSLIKYLQYINSLIILAFSYFYFRFLMVHFGIFQQNTWF